MAPINAVKIDLLFKIGDYGWSESYYLEKPSESTLRSFGTKAKNLAERRAKLFGNGVYITGARISDVDVRRDAYDLPFKYLVDSGESVPGYLRISPALNSDALIPNVAVVCRVEGTFKVYHGAHYLSGVPRVIVGQDDLLVFVKAWADAAEAFGDYLASSGWSFLALGRAGLYADRNVLTANVATGVVTINPGWGLIPGTTARWRLINWTKEQGTTTRSFAALGTKDGEDTIRFGANVLPSTWSAGPKSIVHPEQTIVVSIDTFETERVSHRNRGRPSDSPRGRRKRR